MKQSEAENLVCPSILSSGTFGALNCCKSSKCMAWVTTKTHREMTFKEQERYKEYERKAFNLMRYQDKSIEYDTETIHRLKEEYKDVININLELPDCNKEGYCNLYREY